MQLRTMYKKGCLDTFQCQYSYPPIMSPGMFFTTRSSGSKWNHPFQIPKKDKKFEGDKEGTVYHRMDAAVRPNQTWGMKQVSESDGVTAEMKMKTVERKKTAEHEDNKLDTVIIHMSKSIQRPHLWWRKHSATFQHFSPAATVELLFRATTWHE